MKIRTTEYAWNVERNFKRRYRLNQRVHFRGGDGLKLKANKQNTILTLICIIILALLLLFREDIKYVKTQSIDLSKEHIGGMHIGQKYNVENTKKLFGDQNRVAGSHEKNTKAVQFLGNTFIAIIIIDNNDDTVKRVALDDDNGSINTSKNINCDSSLKDIIREYGNNYYKRTWNDFMGSGNGYAITFIDKENKYKLEFAISQRDLIDEIELISFSKY